MRHRCHRGQLSRPTGHRKALLRNLTVALIDKERIRTTEAKAKVLRPLVEKLVTLGRSDSTHHRRQVFAEIGKKQAVHKLFSEIGPRFKSRPGGYLRIVRDGQRQGDGAWMAYIEFVERESAGAPAPEMSEPAAVPAT
ncbi:50S ribosomal protein L17 [Candidatus Poribacteria bacterium]|nr:50S ribosomal protein L17 [Candidatus Poribacteria bacterium]